MPFQPSKSRRKKTLRFRPSALGFLLLGMLLGYQGQLPRQQAFRAGDTKIQVRFSPRGGCTDLAVTAIQQAQKEIKVFAYSFTSQAIAAALFSAHQRGVRVRLLADRSQQHSRGSRLASIAGAFPVRIAKKVKIMHHKVLVIDGKRLVTGSFNWSENAERYNAENLLLIDQEELSLAYGEEFERLWALARPYTAQ